MSESVLRQRPRRVSLPEGLESAQAKLVYLYLGHVESATIEELGGDLGLSQLTILPLVDHLADRDLVARNGEALELVG